MIRAMFGNKIRCQRNVATKGKEEKTRKIQQNI